jgi:hypothetical protein
MAGVWAIIAWQTASTYNDIWAIDFTVAIVALYLIAMRSAHRWRWLIACGLCAGIGAYFRPALILIVPALAVATALSTGWREALRRAALATVVACVMLVPWTVRNYKDFHAFVPTRSAFWLTAWGGLNEMRNDFGETFTFAAIIAKLRHTHPHVASRARPCCPRALPGRSCRGSLSAAGSSRLHDLDWARRRSPPRACRAHPSRAGGATCVWARKRRLCAAGALARGLPERAPAGSDRQSVGRCGETFASVGCWHAHLPCCISI